MSGIKLVKRIKYAGDVHSALMELGWDAKTAAAFLDDIPDADAETVFEQIGLVKEAFDMAKSSLVPVVRCKDCKYYESTHYGHMCKCWEAWLPTTVYFIREDDDFCSYGEKRSGEHE